MRKQKYFEVKYITQLEMLHQRRRAFDGESTFGSRLYMTINVKNSEGINTYGHETV